MHRARYLWLIVLVPVLAGSVLTGCTSYPEDQQVRKFFVAAKLRDNMTLANIATVGFDPQKDGIVESFSIVAVTPEQSRPLESKAAFKAFKDAEADQKEFEKTKREYQDKNLDAIERVLKLESKGGRVTGADAKIQAEWTKWRQETAEHAKKVSEARAALSREIAVANLSVVDRDVTGFDGTEFSKDVTVDARVKSPDGQSSSKTLVLTMQRVVLKGEGAPDIEGRWMITNLKAGAPTAQ